MNERMQKLELEAIAYADSKVPANDRYNDIYHSIVRRKFAELLVKETTNVIIIGHKGHMNPALARDSVKQHFGVEE